MRNKFELILLFLVINTIAFAQNATIKNNSERAEKIDNFFNDLVSRNKIAGVTVLISEKSVIKLQKSFGFLDKENNIPMTDEAIVPIGSMTKIITTVAVLQLYEQGYFSLDDPIEKYIPELQNLKVSSEPYQDINDSIKTENPRRKPTIVDFLRHTSGMTYYGDGTVTDKLYTKAGFKTWNKSLKEFATKVGEIPLSFQPGESWDYGLSFDILGYLVEIISQKSLEQYCVENIFKPLGMFNTDFYVKTENKENLTNLYKFENDSLTLKINRNNSKYLETPPVFSGGGGWSDSYCGIVSTTNDFYNICSMLLNYGKFKDKQILNRETVESMTSNQIGEIDAYGKKYGLGVGVITGKDKTTVFWAGAPYNTYFWIDYNKNLIGIMFPNTAPFGHFDMMNKFKELTDSE